MLRERTRRISYGIQCLPQPALFVCLGMLGCLAGAISAIDTPDLELKNTFMRDTFYQLFPGASTGVDAPQFYCLLATWLLLPLCTQFGRKWKTHCIAYAIGSLGVGVTCAIIGISIMHSWASLVVISLPIVVVTALGLSFRNLREWYIVRGIYGDRST